MNKQFNKFLKEFREFKRNKDPDADFPSNYQETRLAVGMMLYAKELDKLNLL